MNLFKKTGKMPEHTSEGLLYTFTKLSSQAMGQYGKEQNTTLTLLQSSAYVRMKGYTPTGGYVNEKYDIIGPPEFDSVTGRTWNPIGIDGGLLMWIAISELRGGFGLTLKFPDNMPGTYFFYR